MRACIAFAAILIATAAAAATPETTSHDCPELPRTVLPLPSLLSQSACANGDFETELDAKEWFGQHGSVTWTGDPSFHVEGLLEGALDSCDAHQSAVRAGLDPNAPIRTVAPGGSTTAVRIGNSKTDARTDMLGKTFLVDRTRSVISFSYAVVMQDPQHDKPYKQPSFEVHVVDAKGGAIAVDLGKGSNRIIAGDPFLNSVQGTNVVYRDWTCVRLDLTAYIGQRVTVLFITEDCTLGAHYAYAYIDEFCGGGHCGPSWKFERAVRCGDGEVCFRYVDRPDDAVLRVLPDGQVVATLVDARIDGERICFPIDPKKLTDRDWIDLAATATFGNTVLSAGSGTEGLRPGRNNDYRPSCGTPGCCSKAVNVIANGDFEAGNTGFETGYGFALGPYTAGAVGAGEYAVLNGAEAASVAASWRVSSHAAACPNDGKFLVVNGETCGGRARKVWSQTVAVTPGATYRFCARVKNLPQGGFDVKPSIELRFTRPLATVARVVDIASGDPCDWMLVDTELVIPTEVTSIAAEIWLTDRIEGDGNDLAVDDISLQQLEPGSSAAANVDVVPSAIENGTYTIAATPADGPAIWELCEVDGNDQCIEGTRIVSTSGFADRRFDTRKTYRLIYTTDDPCTILTTRTWTLTPRP